MNLDAFFKAALESSWQASLVIVLILLLRPLLGLRVPARWRSMLWTLMLLRLLVPAFLLPPSPASLQNIAVVDRPIEQASLVLGKTPGAAAPAELRRQGPEPGELISSSTENAIVAPHQRSWWWIAAVVWLLGAILAAIWIFAATVRLHRRVRRDSTAATESIESVSLLDKAKR